MHRRLSSWGINTAALWSDPELTAMHRTPYVDWIFYWPSYIGGYTTQWKHMVDMWDPDFETKLSEAAAKLHTIKEDPWLIGVFVDNELPWQDAKSFAIEVLTAPRDQPAKVRFVSHLRKKYAAIGGLNKFWRSDYASWDALLRATQIPAELSAKDADEFYNMSAVQYYRTVRDVIKDTAPDTLYLGSRLNGDYPIPARAAAKYCDVVSYNLYRDGVSDFSIAGDIDKPVIIGEWHFGAAGSGVLGRGLVQANSRADRARKYRQYIIGALRNEQIVGAHWFTYMDQNTAGRVQEGQNHQIGFVSITDTPYTELIGASRDVGYRLYQIRVEASVQPARTAQR